MGHTLAEKIIMKHTGDTNLVPGDLVIVEPDFVIVHDIYTESLYKKFKEMGLKKVWNPDKIGIIHDHLMPACLQRPRKLKGRISAGKGSGNPSFPSNRWYCTSSGS